MYNKIKLELRNREVTDNQEIKQSLEADWKMNQTLKFVDKGLKINKINIKIKWEEGWNYWMETMKHYNKEFESLFKKTQTGILELQKNISEALFLV